MRRTLALLVLLTMAGCSDEPASGPVDVVFDRDSCALCRMMIIDPAFVAEVRGGAKRRIEIFDDIGCALNWLNSQPWAADGASEIWVAERTSTRARVVWLDARKAFFVPTPGSPMNYNMAATREAVPGALDFDTMARMLLAGKPNHICPVPGEKP